MSCGASKPWWSWWTSLPRSCERSPLSWLTSSAEEELRALRGTISSFNVGMRLLGGACAGPAWRAAAQQAKWLLPAFLELRGCLFEKKKKKEVHIQKSVLQSADAVFFREVLSCCFKGSVEAGRQSLIIIQTSRKKVRSKSAYIVMAPEDLRRKIKKAGRPPGTRDTVPTVHG